jgi:hypothetical protein
LKLEKEELEMEAVVKYDMAQAELVEKTAHEHINDGYSELNQGKVTWVVELTEAEISDLQEHGIEVTVR